MSNQVKLQDIVVDPTIQVREVEGHTVSEYAQAMRAGAQFPPLVIENGSNRLVCGNHRYFAYKRVLEPTDTVSVEYRDFEDEAAIIRTAAKDNATHGRPLDTWDRKRITVRLQEAGDSIEDIAALLSVPVAKVENWAGMTVTVIGKRGKKTVRHSEPVKHGLEHLAGKQVPEDQYNCHAQMDRGVPARQNADTLRRWIENGWIAGDDRTRESLRQLATALEQLFAREEKSA
jgi:hypothetical protein